MNAPDPTHPRLTQGHLLDGRIRYAQPAQGFRSGIEPVLLAASIPAQPGQRVLEAGTGAGAALLCLAERVRGVRGIGVDRDEVMVRIARDNARANGQDTLAFLTADIAALPLSGTFHHAFANPPYHLAGGTASPVTARGRAKRGEPGLLDRWAAALARPLRHRGTLSFILPADHLPACLAAMTGAGCAVARVLPFWPKLGRPARLVIVQGVKGGRMPTVLEPGMLLHRAEGGFTDAADAVLRRGEALTQPVASPSARSFSRAAGSR